ncbi:MAG: hypothetical protein ACD_4C00133G0001 [uncultured bacterium (gcode 4)]|uniref:Uncharacterized protein n=1 Tax=uncultured bacterium (gcode 4) TaxID=1234023 RepID=K2FV83_9BACT|nr:MAG: hypothetical protein ACD_4C00133G0001 [uncultured bacterium (gcode 4)]
MNALYEWIGFEKIVRIKNSLDWVDWKNPWSVTSRISSLMFQKNSNWTYSGIVGENLESLRSQWVDNEVITRVIDGDGSRNIKDYRNQILKGTPYKNPEAQKFMVELVKEWGLASNMVWIINEFWFWDYANSFENWDAFTVRQLLILKSITWWKTDLASMSKGTRAELYMALFGIIFEKNPISLTGKKIIEFANTPNNKYVEEIVEFIWTQVDRASYEWMLVSIWLTEDSLKLLNEVREKNPSIFYWAISFISLSFVAAYYVRVPMITATVAIAIIKGAAWMAWITYIWSKLR